MQRSWRSAVVSRASMAGVLRFGLAPSTSGAPGRVGTALVREVPTQALFYEWHVLLYKNWVPAVTQKVWVLLQDSRLLFRVCQRAVQLSWLHVPVQLLLYDLEFGFWEAIWFKCLGL